MQSLAVYKLSVFLFLTPCSFLFSDAVRINGPLTAPTKQNIGSEQTRIYEEVSPPQQLSLEGESSNSLSNRITAIRKSQKSLRFKQFLYIQLISRIVFLLCIPISVIPLTLTLISTVFTLCLRIITLNFTNRETFSISFAFFRISFSLLLASVIGLINPIFSIFGFVATFSYLTVQLVEPVLRIKYRREMKRLKHLHKLMTDPVLLDTLDMLVTNSKRIADKATLQKDNRILKIKNHHHNNENKSPTGQPLRLTTSSSSSSSNLYAAENSQLAQILSESATSGIQNQQLIERVSKKMPSQLQTWSKEQYQSFLKSGMLEQGIQKALDALHTEIEQVREFIPYLEAIQKVQQDNKQKMGVERRGRNVNNKWRR